MAKKIDGVHPSQSGHHHLIESWVEDADEIFSRSEKRAIRNSFGNWLGNIAINFATRLNHETRVRARIERNEQRLSEFEAYQECPACGQYDFHQFTIKEYRKIVRICNHCKHEWEQQ